MTTILRTTPFLHLDRSVVRGHLEKRRKRLRRSVRSGKNPLQFQNLPSLLQKAQRPVSNDENLGMADLGSLSARTTDTQSMANSSQAVLCKDLFTCPITLDIMEQPLTTTTPCERMFRIAHSWMLSKRGWRNRQTRNFPDSWPEFYYWMDRFRTYIFSLVWNKRQLMCLWGIN